MEVSKNSGASDWCLKTLSFYDAAGNRITVQPGMASAESQYADNMPASRASVYPNTGSRYCSKAGKPTGWIQYEFKEDAPEIKSYKVESYGTAMPVDWKMKHSVDNGQTWTLVDTQSGFDSPHEEKEFQITPPPAPAPPPPPPSPPTTQSPAPSPPPTVAGLGAGLWRMEVSKNSGASDWCLKTLSFYDAAGNRITVQPGMASAESQYADNMPASRASVYPNTGSRYCSKAGKPTGWIQYEFKEDAPEIKSYKVESYGTAMPVDWKMKHSVDNGQTWTLVDTQSGFDSPHEEKEFQITPPPAPGPPPPPPPPPTPQTAGFVVFDSADSKLTVSPGKVALTTLPSAPGWGHAANSNREFSKEDSICGISFKCGSQKSHGMIGLSGKEVTKWTDFNYGFTTRGLGYGLSSSRFDVYEDSSHACLSCLKFPTGQPTTATLAVFINSGGEVEYSLDGTVFQTSSRSVTYPWHAAVDVNVDTNYTDIQYIPCDTPPKPPAPPPPPATPSPAPPPPVAALQTGPITMEFCEGPRSGQQFNLTLPEPAKHEMKSDFLYGPGHSLRNTGAIQKGTAYCHPNFGTYYTGTADNAIATFCSDYGGKGLTFSKCDKDCPYWGQTAVRLKPGDCHFPKYWNKKELAADLTPPPKAGWYAMAQFWDAAGGTGWKNWATIADNEKVKLVSYYDGCFA